VPTATKFALRSVARRYEALSAEIAELEAVMNSIRNGLVMRKAGDRGGAGQPKNPYFNAVLIQVHNTVNTLCVVARRRFGSA
jgi:hypothetical protein